MLFFRYAALGRRKRSGVLADNDNTGAAGGPHKKRQRKTADCPHRRLGRRRSGAAKLFRLRYRIAPAPPSSSSCTSIRASSELPSIFAARTKMPVVQVETQQKLVANHVYVIAPDRRLQMSITKFGCCSSTSRAAGDRRSIFCSVRWPSNWATGSPSFSAAPVRTARSACAPSRKPAASFWCRTRTKPNIPRCRAAPSLPARRTSSCPRASLPSGSPN